MLREQAIFLDRMDERLNPLQNTQTATSWDLPAKWAQYGQNSLERGRWDVDSWVWDSNLFVAKSTSECSSRGMLQQNASEHNSGWYQNLDLGLGLQFCSHDPDKNERPDVIVEQASLLQGKRFLTDEPSSSSLNRLRDPALSDSDASLALKLGGETYAIAEENGFQNSKRSRVASPGSQSPVCQVDDCLADLSNAKDYHRRHRVCEVHAKANKAAVGRLMQRFCQQCSRFHLLQEFDEGKRSCRRRLAGHNKRRRKTQPDPTTSSPPGDEGAARAAGVLGLINLLYQLQALRTLNPPNGTMTDLEWLLRLLTKTNPSLSELRNSLEADGRITSSNIEHHQLNSKSTFDQLSQSQPLLAALSSIHPEASSILKNQTELRREEHSVLGRIHGVGVGSLSSQINQTDENVNNVAVETINAFSRPILQHEESRMLENGFVSFQNPITSSDRFHLSSNAPMTNKTLGAEKHLQLVADNANLGSCSLTQTKRLGGNSIRDVVSEGILHDKARPDQMRPVIDLQKLPPGQIREHSDTASDNSSEEDMQEWTGRIVFKLFDRNPGEIPHNIRSQIYEWLYQRPTNMESYIRPGCIIFSIFLSMHELAWKELLKDLQLSLRRLLQIGNCTFWNKGCIFVQIGEANAIIADGEVYASKFESSANLPQLISVRPLAVVAGEETEITVKGHNLTVSGTSIFCAYSGKYERQDVLLGQPSAGSFVQSDDHILAPQEELSFLFNETLNTIGRCFIEVERFGIGDFFPVIIADKEICSEIRALEKEIECTAACINGQNADEATFRVDMRQKGVEVETKIFLNDLGWLFHFKNLQRSYSALELYSNTRISFARFKRLLLYAVDHDLCAVLKQLLDLFCTSKVGSIDSVLDLGLLHKAVKRKYRPIVDMLLAYDVGLHDPAQVNATEVKIMKANAVFRREFVFRPNLSGPAGLTPLHIAASMQDAEELVDALTNDFAQVGLEAWNSCQDAAGQTPFAYALSRGYQSYINLVEAKRSCKDVTSLIIRDLDTASKEEMNSCMVPALSSTNTEKQCLESYSIEMPVWPNFSNTRSLDIQMSTSQRACRLCQGQMLSKRIGGIKGPAFRPFLLSMVAIATVCVCVCVVLKGPPEILFVLAPFTWESVGWGYI